MLKIYFTASAPTNSQSKLIYKKIIRLLGGSHILSGKQFTDKKAIKADSSLTPEEIFVRQKNKIEKADLVIAEVTDPSLGVGGEIVYALTHDIPVLALAAEESEDKLTPLIAGNPSDNLYLEHYNKENIKYRISEFLSHIKKLNRQKGLLIVIDGGDGSGKTTQSKMLVDYLKKNKYLVTYIHFPRYYSSFHGRTVAKFLRGEFGTIDQVSPYLASLAYALDRASMKDEMERFMQKGGIIVTDRYAPSNLAHQGSKFLNEKDRNDYLEWDYELEYKVHKIPKEKIVIYLHVPTKTAIDLASKRGERAYLAGKRKDIHEDSAEHLKRTEEMYMLLSNKFPHWEVIDCAYHGKLKSKEEIHKMILKILNGKKIIQNL